MTRFLFYRAAFLIFCAVFPAVALWPAYYPNMQYGPKRQLAPGVSWQTATHANPAWSIQIFEIDMSNRNVELIPVFKTAGNVAGSSNERTSSMAERSHAIAAVNAGFYDTSNRMTNSFTLIDGQFIGGASTAMRPEGGRSALGFSGNHQAIPKRTKLSSGFVPASPGDWDKITDAIAGRGHFVTSHGVLVTVDNESTTSSHYDTRHPRTAIGYSLNPYRAWLVTVDGRQPGFSVGMTHMELGQLMADLGIEQSISLDGGGSTTAWVKGEGVVNSISDSSEREVVSAWTVQSAITMDNTVEEFSRSGSWVAQANHDEQYYLNHFFSTLPTAEATWTPDLARDGLYRVYAWWASNPTGTQAAQYTVHHHEGEHVVIRNQRINGGKWNLLGTHPFRAGTDGFVKLSNAGSGVLSADAVRFVFVESDPERFWAPSDWKTVMFDGFSGSAPPGYGFLVMNPPGASGNGRWERNFDYTTLTGPVLPAAPDGDGRALRTSANNVAPASNQILYQTWGPADMEDSAVEASLLSYLASNNSAGSTTWGGIGIRMSDNLRDGYFVQQRTDDSGSFGHYLNFYRIQDGNTMLIGRYYYRVGTGGITQGVNGDSRAIRSPQRAAVNEWVRLRIEAVRENIALFIDDMEAPVTIFADPAPIRSGKAMLFHEDPFGESLTAPAGSAGTLFESFQVDRRAVPVEDWTARVETVVPLGGGGTRVTMRAAPNAEYVIEASSDLLAWTVLAGVYETDQNGLLTFDDPAAGNRRFWRISRLD